MNKALSVAEESRDLCHVAELHRLKGDLAAKHDKVDVAEAIFQKSIKIAQEQQSKAFELRATTSLARLYKQTNYHGVGRARLEAVLASFVEGFVTPDLTKARALVVHAFIFLQKSPEVTGRVTHSFLGGLGEPSSVSIQAKQM